MSKRGADNYMTDQNWDQEVEEEEAGMFKQADKDVLQSRQVRKAKRRCGAEDGSESSSGTGGVFKGFTGFGKTSSSSAASAFGSLGSKPLGFSNGSGSTLKNDEPAKTSIFGSKVSETKDSSNTLSVEKPQTNGGDSSKSPSSSRSKYLHQLKSLNEGVTKWIKEHVDKNAYCVLTPIFRDYEKYLADIEKKYPNFGKDEDEKEAANESGEKTEETKEKSDTEPTKISFTSAAKAATSDEKTSETSTTVTSPPLFKFGSSASPSSSDTSTTTTASATGLFSTTTSTSGGSGTSGFSGFNFGTKSSSVFGGSSGATTSGFSFASVKQTENKEEAAGPSNADDEEYVPPKAEVSEISEDDALYTKRCKLFFKKDDQWKEKGVGNLHLKPCGDKTQLLIRADTNLGNILLNIMLSATLPVSRQGKNNVAIVCVPNPPIEKESSEMTPMLIRVKTAEDADELLEKLNENKR